LTIQRNIPPTDRDHAIASLSRLVADYLPGKPLRVTITQLRSERTHAQNNALFGVAYAALKEQTGNDPDDLHTYFCGEFFGWEEIDVMGKKRVVPRRTTTTDENGRRSVMPKIEFSDFYGFIQRRAAEVGYDVPDPE